MFGATPKAHSFQLTKHSREEIALFEEQLGVGLPDEYVHVLTETGSGTGPDYGLLPPQEVLANIQIFSKVVIEEGRPLPKPGAAFPFQQSDADEIARRAGDGTEYSGKAIWLSNGCIPISYQGCTGWNALATAGEQRGKIWEVNDDGKVADWWPSRGARGWLLPEGSFESGRWIPTFMPRSLAAIPSPPTVLQWYESWLERMETDLDDYAEFLRRK